MLIISYDSLRTKFAMFLGKFGGRLQYSVFEMRNSERALENITTQIKHYFEKKFSQTDSVIIFNFSKQCKITRFGSDNNIDLQTHVLM